MGSISPFVCVILFSSESLSKCWPLVLNACASAHTSLSFLSFSSALDQAIEFSNSELLVSQEVFSVAESSFKVHSLSFIIWNAGDFHDGVDNYGEEFFSSSEFNSKGRGSMEVDSDEVAFLFIGLVVMDL